MTERQEKHADFLKRNWIGLSNVVLLITFIINVSMWKQRVDDRLEHLEQHALDKNLHMPLHRKMEIFTTRNEYNGMIDKINKIDAKVDLLLQKELTNDK